MKPSNRTRNNPERILVIRLSSLGDIVLTTLLLRCLRETYPTAVIDFLLKPAYQGLIPALPYINEGLILPQGFFKRKWKKELRARKYDTVIDLQNNITSRWITSSLNPSRVLRYTRPRLNRWVRIHLPSRRDGLAPSIPVPLGYLNICNPLSVTDDGGGLELLSGVEDTARVHTRVASFAHQHGLPNQTIIVIAPGAQHATKMWVGDYWIDFLHRAFHAGYTLQVIIGSEDETLIAGEIQDRVRHPVCSLVGELSLSETIALIARSTVLVCGDSGPMHIATAVGTPVVALFGPTVEQFGFAPFRARSKVVTADDLYCRPCSAHGGKTCPEGHFRCMTEILPEIVMEQMVQLLAQTPPDPSRLSKTN